MRTTLWRSHARARPIEHAALPDPGRVQTRGGEGALEAFPARPWGRARPSISASRRLLFAGRWLMPGIVVLLLLVSSGASLGSPVVGGAPAPVSSPLAHASSSPAKPVVRSLSLLSPTAPLLAPTPASTVANGSFYQNTTLSAVPSANEFCAPSKYTFAYCYPDDQDPTALLLRNGSIGLAFSRMTNGTSSTCANATRDTVIRVAFSVSKDNGSTFGTPTMLGNDTCPYLQALEPSFGVSDTGAIYGTFVEANVTAGQMYPYPWDSGVIEYSPRSSDALGFVDSLDNGTTFSNVTTITVAGNANIARPALATFGRTVYIVYENLSNGTTYLPSSTTLPISIDLVYSSDGGATWHGPYALPGLNSSESYNAMSPSIAVNRTGTVSIAYATDRHCVAYCAGPYYWTFYGDSIVVATSISNGTAWSGPAIVSNDTAVGESSGYYGPFFISTSGPFLFEASPQTSIAFSGSGTTVYVAWAGAVNRSSNWASFDAYSGVSTTGGSTFRIGPVSHVESSVPPYVDSAFDPSVSVSPSGTIYYTYTFLNESYYQGCGGIVSPIDYGYHQGILTSADGLNWSAPFVTEIVPGYVAYAQDIGHLASIAFSASGSPIVAYTFVKPQTILYVGGHYYYPYPTGIQVATSWSGPTVTLTADEHNLTAGTTWGVTIDGIVFSSTGNNVTVPNVPEGVPVLLGVSRPGIMVGYRAEMVASLGGTIIEPTLLSNRTIDLNYSLYYGIAFNVDPKDVGFSSIYLENQSASPYLDFYHYWVSYGSYYSEFGSCPFPWYFSAGTHFRVGYVASPVGAWVNAPLPVSYWNGTGNGSFTGAGQTADLTVSGPFNETFWVEPYGTYNVSVRAPTLPSTSTFHFDWDGTAYSGSASGTVMVSNVSTGIHRATGVWATSSSSGWEYIGTLGEGGLIAVPDEPVVNLTFAYEDLGTPAGSVHFHAIGLTNGTVWHFSLNGTEYGSSTPWINVTTHTGTYLESGYPVVSANGSVAYAPLGLAPSLNVTVGSTYAINFTVADQLTVDAGSGGRVTPGPGSYWLAPGATRNLSASPSTGNRFVGWSGTGAGSYTGTSFNATVTMDGPVVETASFAPLVANRFNLTFVDSYTLPNGTWWTVYVDGVGYSSNGSYITVPNVYSCAISGSLGRYTLAVPYAYVNSSAQTRYVPMGYPSQVCGDSVVSIAFNVQYLLTLEATAGGTVTATDSSVQSSYALWASPSDLVSLQATTSNGYLFLGWNGTGPGNYTGTVNPQQIALSGPVTELGSFARVVIPPPPRYNVDFHLGAALGDGTVWTLTMNGTTYASSGTDLIISGLLAHTYAVSVAAVKSPDAQTLYTPVGAPSSVNVVANQTVTLTFKTSYWVSVDVSGNGEASIQVGSTNATLGWYASGTAITLNATPTSPWLFNGWTGSGPGAYSGSASSFALHVSGPMHEVAGFIPPAPATRLITSAWTTPLAWVGLAVAGAVVGLVVGLLVARMRKGGRS